MQNALKDGILKFSNKQKPCPEEEIETKIEALFVEPIEIMVVDIVDDAKVEDNKPNIEDQTTKANPKAKEELVDFLNYCRLKDSEVMLCPRWSSVFDKEAAKELESTNPYQAKKFVRQDKPKGPFSNKEKGATKFQGRTYVPTIGASLREWLRSAWELEIGGGKWKVMNVDYDSSYWDKS